MSRTTIERFSECLPSDLSRTTVANAWQDLVTRYSEPHRYYHTLAHISSLLDLSAALIPESAALQLAIWYHDSVYDPHSPENEQASADYFTRALGAQLDNALVEDVVRLILATDHRRPRGKAHDEQLIIDLDLTILAQSREEYAAYSASIRREYGFVPDPEYRRGRSAFLSRFLEHQIYTTSAFQPLEAAARDNLLWELRGLQ
jgi:predicted metal-dependent HD superfamily phosphohydrolase